MRKFKPWGKDGYIATCYIKELTNIPAILKREVYQTVTLYLIQIQLIDIRLAAAKPSNFVTCKTKTKKQLVCP